MAPCPNFATFVCPALATAGTTGYFQPDAVAALRHASVSSYMAKIKIPTLLMQGENDTLFNLNEAVATYRALKAQGTPVKMVWQSWGHSDSTPAPGELDLANPNPATQYETARISDWFDHYLKGSSVSTGPVFAYFRDWVTYSGIATPAYATLVGLPGRHGQARTTCRATRSWRARRRRCTTGAQSFITPPAGAPEQHQPGRRARRVRTGGPSAPQADLPGTFAAWTGRRWQRRSTSPARPC